ncbi:hypothetical protein C8R45DRAFT_1106109 [Mycena sanguinolenta]|nr:hypothetical protein C8R45DRAFT_1106109 [Mycena sanguinolenta]
MRAAHRYTSLLLLPSSSPPPPTHTSHPRLPPRRPGPRPHSRPPCASSSARLVPTRLLPYRHPPPPPAPAPSNADALKQREARYAAARERILGPGADKAGGAGVVRNPKRPSESEGGGFGGRRARRPKTGGEEGSGNGSPHVFIGADYTPRPSSQIIHPWTVERQTTLQRRPRLLLLCILSPSRASLFSFSALSLAHSPTAALALLRYTLSLHSHSFFCTLSAFYTSPTPHPSDPSPRHTCDD